MAFDPFAPVPPEVDTQPVITPVSASQPNQFGMVYGSTGVPSDIDPSQTAANTQRAADDLATWRAAHPGLAGDAGAPAVAPPPVAPATGAPVPAPDVAAPPVPTPAGSFPVTSTGKPHARPAAPGAPTAPAGPNEQQQAMTEAGTLAENRAKAAEETGAAAATAATEKADALDAAAAKVREQQNERDRWEQAQGQARERYQSVADQAEKEVENHKFHDYWSTRSTGSRIATAIGAFLSGMGGGAQGVSVFMQNLDAKMSRDMEQQKADLSKKISLADAKRRGVKDFEGYVRDQRAALDLKDANKRLALADEVDAIAARGGAKVDQAKAREMATQLRADGQNQKLAVKAAFEKSETEHAHAKLMLAEAGKARAQAGQIRAQAQSDKQFKAVDARAKDFQRELVNQGRGPLSQLERIDAMNGVLQQAITAGDTTAATRVLEEAGSMLSGGKSTKQSAHLLLELKSARDQLTEQIGRVTGNPGAAAAYSARLGQLLQGAAEEKRREIDEHRQRYIEGEMGAHGFAKDAGAKERVLGHAAQLFGSVRNADGSPRYQEGGGSSTPAQAAAPSVPAGAVMGTLNGKRGYALNGKFYPVGQ